MSLENSTREQVTENVRTQYAGVARSKLSSEHAGVRAVAQAFGYSEEELASLPAEANMGLSCGNPTASASLREGEVVVDLGCGGGLDVLLAARKVGPSGKAIGIDMTADMIERARRNAAQGVGGKPVENAEFYLAHIDDLPLPEGSVDCVISNCVINLAPDKPAVFREIVRVLRPGGRLAVSDIALKQVLPEELKASAAAYVGCISGALLIEEYRAMLVEAGFAAVEVVDSGADLNAYAKVENQAACCSPPAENSSADPFAVVEEACCTPAESTSDEPAVHEQLAELFRRYDINQYAASVRVFAVKP